VSGILIVIFLVLLILVVVALATMVRVLQEYERAVIFRLGNVLRAPKGPGLFLILPFGIDRMRKVNLQTVAMNVPPQDVITRDNMMVRVDAVVYLRVVDPVKAVVEIQNYLFATSQAAQTNLRVILGKKTLNELLSAREEINAALSAVIAGVTAPWGVRVTSVEINNVDLPEELLQDLYLATRSQRSGEADARLNESMGGLPLVLTPWPPLRRETSNRRRSKRFMSRHVRLPTQRSFFATGAKTLNGWRAAYTRTCPPSMVLSKYSAI